MYDNQIPEIILILYRQQPLTNPPTCVCKHGAHAALLLLHTAHAQQRPDSFAKADICLLLMCDTASQAQLIILCTCLHVHRQCTRRTMQPFLLLGPGGFTACCTPATTKTRSSHRACWTARQTCHPAAHALLALHRCRHPCH